MLAGGFFIMAVSYAAYDKQSTEKTRAYPQTASAIPTRPGSGDRIVAPRCVAAVALVRPLPRLRLGGRTYDLQVMRSARRRGGLSVVGCPNCHAPLEKRENDKDKSNSDCRGKHPGSASCPARRLGRDYRRVLPWSLTTSQNTLRERRHGWPCTSGGPCVTSQGGETVRGGGRRYGSVVRPNIQATDLVGGESIHQSPGLVHSEKPPLFESCKLERSTQMQALQVGLRIGCVAADLVEKKCRRKARVLPATGPDHCSQSQIGIV